jgi:PPM family protein phosphatase
VKTINLTARGARRRPASESASPRTWVHADVGARSNQEDAALTLSTATTTVLVVADGMGGHAAGEVASREAVREVERRYRAGARALDLPGVLDAAHHAVARAATGSRAGMGACAVALACDLGSGTATVAWAGDCRCWRLRDGSLERLTVDHGPSDGEVALAGETARALALDAGLTAAEAEVAATRAADRLRHVVYRALGSGGDCRPDARATDVRAGDVYLLCSDGLEALAPAVIACALGSTDPARDLVRAVLALETPHQDNVAVAVAKFA